MRDIHNAFVRWQRIGRRSKQPWKCDRYRDPDVWRWRGGACGYHPDPHSNSSGTGNFSLQLSDPGVIGFSGQSLGLGATGAFLGLGDGGDGSYLIGGSYTVKLASGAGYIGVFKFRCQ